MEPFPFDSHGTTEPLMRFSRNTRGELCILTYIVAAAMDSHGYKLETECKFIAKKRKLRCQLVQKDSFANSFN